jgi:hypothetical protein
MPAGGGDPKVIGDGQTVVIRPEFSRGGSDLWDMKDIVVALLEEREEFRAAVAASVDYATLKAGIAALPRRVVLLDHVGV